MTVSNTVIAINRAGGLPFAPDKTQAIIMRRNLVVGNWKMNGDRAVAGALCADIATVIGADDGAEIVICPPFPLIPTVSAAVSDTVTGWDSGTSISIGAQDLDANQNGAFTGQVSGAMLADCGCRYVIVGHSERRALYGERDELVARKTCAALSAGLRPIVCVGETAAERDDGATEQVVGRQLDTVLDTVTESESDFTDAVIAYEPVWAIGTGNTATPAQAQAVHAFIREKLNARAPQLAAQCRILYGGSMKPDNAAALLAEPDIDGGLIGGASLNAADFVNICRAAA